MLFILIRIPNIAMLNDIETASQSNSEYICSRELLKKILLIAPTSEFRRYVPEYYVNMAEREGFEPSDPARDHLISSQARSAAPAPLQCGKSLAVTGSDTISRRKHAWYRSCRRLKPLKLAVGTHLGT